MLSDFQNYLRDETAVRLEEKDNEKITREFTQAEKNQALLEIASEILAENGFQSRFEAVDIDEGHGQARFRVDGVYLDDEAADLYLYTSQYVEDCSAKATKDQLFRYMRQSRRFLESAVRKQVTEDKNSVAAVLKAQELHKAYQEESFNRVIVVIVTNQASAIGGVEIQDSMNEKLDLCFRFEIYDSERLQKVGSKSAQRSDIFIDLEEELGHPLDCLEVLPAKKDYNTYLAIFSGELLYSLFDKFGQQLFEFNVRSFLQARSKVNRGIKNTLQREPEMFLAYNNGLVVTVDEIEVGIENSRSVIRSIRGLQIVNGAQTTSSIYAAKKKFKHDLGKVSVPVKITQVKEDQLAEFVPLISQYANSQNNIQVADLSANHPFHIKMETLSKSIWTPGEQSQWFFERTRGSYESEMMQAASTAKQKKDFLLRFPKAQKFDKTEMAKFLVCWDLRRPFQVALGNQKNFGMFMQGFDDIFGKEWSPDREFFKRLISIKILFTATRKAYMRQTKGFPAPVATYALSFISHHAGESLDLLKIWEQQDVSKGLNDLLEALVLDINHTFLKTAGDRNPSEWAKKEACWKAILDDVSIPDFSKTSEYSMEIAEPGQDDSSSVSEEADVAGATTADRVRQMSAVQLASIALWGRNGQLNKWEIGCLNTVANYASEDWSRTPTIKQLRHIARALNIYDNAADPAA